MTGSAGGRDDPAGLEDRDELVVALSPAEALTIVAALRQYEPYWSAGCGHATVAAHLAATREQITSVVDKLRVAASR